MNNKQLINDGASAQKLKQTIMKEIENRVQTSVVKKFAIMDDKIDKALELIDKLEQTTCAEWNEIKSLLYEIRNESRTFTSQQIQKMPVIAESDEEFVEPRIAKSFYLETSLSLETSFKHSNETTSTKTIIESSTVRAHDTSTTSYIQYKEKLPDPLKTYVAKANISLNTSRVSLNPTTAAEQSQPTKTMPDSPTKNGQPSSSAFDGETKGAEKSEPTSSGLKPSLLHALKRLKVSKATSKPSEPAKTMPQAAAAATASSVKSISVASLKENQRQSLNERINESSESSLTVSEHQKTNDAPQQKSPEVVPDLSICHPELLDLSESNTSTFMKSSKITGTQQKLIHDIQNKTTNEYILPSSPVKKDEYDCVLSSSKPEPPYQGLFDFSTSKISATSTPVRRQKPVPLPRSGSKNSTITNINLPSINQ